MDHGSPQDEMRPRTGERVLRMTTMGCRVEATASQRGTQATDSTRTDEPSFAAEATMNALDCTLENYAPRLIAQKLRFECGVVKVEISAVRKFVRRWSGKRRPAAEHVSGPGPPQALGPP